MTRPHSISTLLVLSTFGCVIDPGVLEGGDDELGDESDTNETDGETGDALVAECLRGTNANGSADSEDFPVVACELTCDEGWGHAAPSLPIAWTLHFEVLEPEISQFPRGIVAREGGDGVVVVSDHFDRVELVTVSSAGSVLGITSVPTSPTSLHLEWLDAAEGVIHLAFYDYETLTGELVTIDEAGGLLWSSTLPGRIHTLAAIPGGGVIVGGPDSLTHIAADGTTSWTAPSITPVSIEVSASGEIAVGGHEPANPDQTMLVLYSDLGEPLESVDVPGSNGQLWDLHFLTERRVFASGTRLVPPTGNGSAQVIDLDAPELGWTREYNRALDSCDDEGALVQQPTWEWFGESAMLSDGTFLVVGAEAGIPQPYTEAGMQPWVIHLDQQGEFLASDRGLWHGQATAVAAGDDGSAYVATTWAGSAGITDVNEAFRGFHLRKYQP